jgi:DNA-directed RNA polymerase subunit E'
MFHKIKIRDYVALQPDLFEGDLRKSLKMQIIRDYTNKTVEDLGIVISVLDIENIGEGFKLPEDSSRHFVVEFSIISFIPKLHEFCIGKISSITQFGAFINLGVIDGLVHLSQTMVDKTSFSKTGAIQGSKTGQTLKIGDMVRASIVAISFKDLKNVKLGLTMRQPGLGSFSWKIKEEN